MIRKVYKTVIVLVAVNIMGIGLLFASGDPGSTPLTRVNMVAVKSDNQILMNPRRWVIYSIREDGATPIQKALRNPATVNLPLGTYRVDLITSQVVRSRVFKVKSEREINIVMRID